MLGDMNMVESTLVLPPNRGASSGRTKVRALDTACVAEPERSTIHTGTCGVTLVTRDKDKRPASNRGDNAYPINGNRTSVGGGKSVSVSVDHGGVRIIKKKNKKKN